MPQVAYKSWKLSFNLFSGKMYQYHFWRSEVPLYGLLAESRWDKNESLTHFPTQEYIPLPQLYPTAHRWLVERLGSAEEAAAVAEAGVGEGLAEVVDLPRP